MYFSGIQSDQFYTWSDANTQTALCRIAETPQCSFAATPAPPSDPPRFSHRALQAMWQAGMQMRRRPGAWPEVLSLGQLPRLAATDGLRAAGLLHPNCRVPRQLPSSPRDSRVDLRDQPRTAAPTRGTLKVCHARSGFCYPSAHGCPLGRYAPGQYAGGLAGQRFRGCAHRGGRE